MFQSSTLLNKKTKLFIYIKSFAFLSICKLQKVQRRQLQSQYIVCDPLLEQQVVDRQAAAVDLAQQRHSVQRTEKHLLLL